MQAQVTGGYIGNEAVAGEYTGTVKRWDMLDTPPSFVEQPAVIVVSVGGSGTHRLEARHLHPSGSGRIVSTTLFEAIVQSDGSFSGQSSNRTIVGQFSIEGGFTAQSNLDGDDTLPHDYAATRVR